MKSFLVYVTGYQSNCSQYKKKKKFRPFIQIIGHGLCTDINYKTPKYHWSPLVGTQHHGSHVINEVSIQVRKWRVMKEKKIYQTRRDTNPISRTHPPLKSKKRIWIVLCSPKKSPNRNFKNQDITTNIKKWNEQIQNYLENKIQHLN